MARLLKGSAESNWELYDLLARWSKTVLFSAPLMDLCSLCVYGVKGRWICPPPRPAVLRAALREEAERLQVRPAVEPEFGIWRSSIKSHQVAPG